LNVHTNPPAAFVVTVLPETVYPEQANDVGAAVESATPSKVRVTIELGAKFVPVIVVLLPIRPFEADNVMVQTATLNAAVAVCAVYVVSLAYNVAAPVPAPTGMVNRQTKAPAAVVVMVEPTNMQVAFQVPLGVIVTPSIWSTTLEDPAYPAPRAVAVELTRPNEGPTVMDQAVTEYGEESFCPDRASLAHAVVAPAEAPLGMRNRQANVPVAVVVIVEPEKVQVAFVPPLGVIAMPSKLSVTFEDAA